MDTNDAPLENQPAAQPSSTDDGDGPATTHAEWGAGNPRLLISRDGLHDTFLLTDDHVRIGAAADCELRLADIEPLHATIDHDEHDEYVLVLHAAADNTSHDTMPVATVNTSAEVLRSGAQVVIEPWRLVFERDEYADHGRPHGGRAGGEGAHQRPQPARPDYSGQKHNDDE